ncbi:MAG: FkbM family methyltransferase [Candidatus Hermodarchaeota archaeon]
MKILTLPNGEIISYIDKLTALDIYDEIYVEDEYFRHGLRLKDNDIVFDVGANIGLFSRYIAKNANNLQIYTFEPVPIIFDVLKENLKDLTANIKNYNIGLGDKEEIINIHYYPRVSADSAFIKFDWDLKVYRYHHYFKETVAKAYPYARFIPKFLRKSLIIKGLKRLYKEELVLCKLRTISDIIEENNIKTINLLKIDAENYEVQVLKGIRQSDWEKIQQISMEVHEHIVGGENLLNTLYKMLEDKGFSVKKGSDNRYSLKMGVYMLYAKRP